MSESLFETLREAERSHPLSTDAGERFDNRARVPVQVRVAP